MITIQCIWIVLLIGVGVLWFKFHEEMQKDQRKGECKNETLEHKQNK